MSADGGRFIQVVCQGGGTERYALDDVSADTLARSLQAYRHWASTSEVRVWVGAGEGMAEIDVRRGEFILRDTLHTLDPLNH
jgi:hypothetical protein